jgi:nucleotide-binding universal stress UspA family protein
MVDKHIVVAVDGSGPSQAALDWAVGQADQLRASITVLTVVETVPAGRNAQLSDELGQRGLEVLENARRRVQQLAPKAHVTTELVHGGIVKSIAQATEQADLLAMGAHRSAMFDWVTRGSLAVRVCEAVTCPVAVIPESEPGGERAGIVVGVDASAEATAAVALAAEHAEASGEPLILVSGGFAPGAPTTARTVSPDSIEHRERLLGETRDRVQAGHPILRVETRMVEATAADAILETGRTASLIVLGHRSQNALDRAFGESVCQDVLYEAQAPVLVVPTPAATRMAEESTTTAERAAPLAADAVVVGWDGSPGAEHALAWALDVLDGRPLVLATVETVDGGRERAEGLAARAERVRRERPGVHVETRTLTAHEARDLAERSTDDQLLVVAAQGRKGAAPTLGGRIAAHARGPVAVVPELDWETAGPVIVGTDGSDASLIAVRFAARNADRRGVPLRIVLAWEAPLAWQDVYSAPNQQFLDELELDNRRVLDRVIEQVQAEFATLEIESVLKLGHPARVLLEAAAGRYMLVVGSRGLGALGRFLLGSVSHTVLLNLTSPTVIVRTKRSVDE